MFKTKYSKLRSVLKVFGQEGDPGTVVTKLLMERDTVMGVMASHGVTGTLTECVQTVLKAANDQHETIMQANVALKESQLALCVGETEHMDDHVYAYFVSYDACYQTALSMNQPPSLSEANMLLATDGKTAGENRVSGMTVVNIDGGIRNWQNIVGISHFIAKNTFGQFQNVSVVIRHFEEINGWKKE